MEYINFLINNKSFKILCVLIVLDTIFGILRAIREKEINSAIGIDGIIRKVGMLIAIIFLAMIDTIVNINLIGFIPSAIREYINIERIGFNELFNVLFIVFEILSIFKNMILCKLPIPRKLQIFLENVMKEFTGEITEKKATAEKVVETIAKTAEIVYKKESENNTND
ncbi:MAG: phage holin family protein [Candidatus Coprovivens sp.]